MSASTTMLRSVTCDGCGRKEVNPTGWLGAETHFVHFASPGYANGEAWRLDFCSVKCAEKWREAMVTFHPKKESRP